MYLPRPLISKLYVQLQRTHHPLSPPVILLVALEPDALCGCRILTHLLKRDYIPHKIKPIAGYNDLKKAGETIIRPMMHSQGGSGGVVVCLGVGGLVDLETLFRFDIEGETSYGGVEIWVIDARRPWNLSNVFGGIPQITPAQGVDALSNKKTQGLDGGKIQPSYKSGNGGIIVFDDGDIDEDLGAEKEAYLAIADMPPIDDYDYEDEDSEVQIADEDEVQAPRAGKKRKFGSDRSDHEGSEEENQRPRQKFKRNPRISNTENPSDHESTDVPTPGERNHSALQSPIQTVVQPSIQILRRRLTKLRRKYESVLQEYYSLGASYSEPISSIMYSLASELGRETNDLLWITIVGVTSMELYGRSSVGVAVTTQNISTSQKGWLGTRGTRIRQLLRDEVRRLNPPDLSESTHNSKRNTSPEASGIIPTTARNPNDTSIRLSPEPRFLLIRHWSLYDSMLHSPYLSARLHVWSENGRKRLHKLLAKMGVSLVQCKQSYTHMDMELKRGLRKKLLKYSQMYGLDELVPPADSDGKDLGTSKEGWGFVRSWGWRATLNAEDVGVVIGAILEVGKKATIISESTTNEEHGTNSSSDEDGILEAEEWVGRFWDAYDALENIEELKAALPIAQHLHRAILRTGTSLIEKSQIRHLRAFRMCIVKDGPDILLFTHPAALTKLALWVGEAISQQEKETRGKLGHGGRGTPLVVASLNEKRGVYCIVGTGGGGGGIIGFGDLQSAEKKQAKQEAKAHAQKLRQKEKEQVRKQRREAKILALGNDTDDEASASESSDSTAEESEDEESDKEHSRGFGRNKFGNAFQEVIDETNARVRIDSFEHCVVEVKKEDLAGFLESLSMKSVVG
ncbi:Bgt-291 [Blumeria graminis f. sp. tritici]|uniref:Bgt-291 n=2 Tax=Blumeria graminis f. sp. tritici TaxID=62690 RepID=A0A381L296_BLUGR|nr:DNA replication initiation factor [Blumeria graminis f. sp. tritici 96224]VCU40075.1 Bgt-291 [Blumeria graminis f. sp. tritici]